MNISLPSWKVSGMFGASNVEFETRVAAWNLQTALTCVETVVGQPLSAMSQIHVHRERGEVYLVLPQLNLTTAIREAELQMRLDTAVDGWNKMIAQHTHTQQVLDATELNFREANKAVRDLDAELRQCREALQAQREKHDILLSNYDGLLSIRRQLEGEVAALKVDLADSTNIANDLHAKLYEERKP